MDIKALAQAAGFDVHPRKGEIRSALDFCGNDITATVEKFARLVAEAERDVCANLCLINGKDAPTQYEREMAAACAASIRKRSNVK